MDENDGLEAKRQVFHLLNGIVIASGVYLLKPYVGLLILLPLLAALLLMYLIPKYMPDFKVANHLLYHFERRSDLHTFPFKGAILFGLGIIPPIALLDVNYGCAVILVFAVGDAFSTIIGRRYGRTRIGDKSLEGTVAFALTSLPAAAVLVSPLHALILSVAGGLAELFDGLDDNITIPVALTLVCLLLGSN